jgi:hypothetical protein
MITGVTVRLSRSFQAYLEDSPRKQSDTAEGGYYGKNKNLKKIQNQYFHEASSAHDEI